MIGNDAAQVFLAYVKYGLRSPCGIGFASPVYSCVFVCFLSDADVNQSNTDILTSNV